MKIGIDLGGTTMTAGLVDDANCIRLKTGTDTLSLQGSDSVIQRMAGLVRTVMDQSGGEPVTHIGIGCPGMLDRAKGRVIYSNNLDWGDLDICDRMRTIFGIPVYLENDANSAAIGEYIAGAGSEYSLMVMITLGTGIGGGIIIDKKLYRGKSGNANILGHLLLHSGGRLCTCGRKGCWEAYASVTAFIRMAGEAADQNRDSLLWQLRNEEDLDGKNIFTAVKKKDPAALRMFDQYTGYLAEGITDIVNMLEPEAVIIGGGISREGDLLLDPVRRMVARNIYCGSAAMPVITAARLGNDAGIIGAACLDQY